ncbi:uncharacterized protein LOC106467732 [Limulus polyphemus]|uniref:Uncharacterized protein LOC106467732 n=1 Tax=Limulus polyphemus TaxID=6850 RepID=A0ABM1T6X2_LIMPO|nr:uncharacterized protein LOC106467732 [Limulus polyphemus]
MEHSKEDAPSPSWLPSFRTSPQDSDKPITYADLGISVKHKTQQTVLGTTRTWNSLSRWEWSYLVVSLLGLSASLGVTIERLVVLKKNSDDYTFAMVLFLTLVFCFYYVIHGVFKERPYELGVFIISNFVVLIYCIINYSSCVNAESTNSESCTQDIKSMKLVRLVLAAVLSPCLITAGIWLFRNYYVSGNLIYRTVGADLALQNMCQNLFLCSTLLKFDLQLEGSMIILVLKNGAVTTDTFERVVLGVGVFFSVIWIILGFLAMRFEQKVMVWIFLGTSFFEPAYVLYEMIKAHTSKELDTNLRNCIYLCGSFALVVRVAVFVYMILVMKNFGQGLRQKVYGIKEHLSSDPPTEIQEDNEVIAPNDKPEP